VVAQRRVVSQVQNELGRLPYLTERLKNDRFEVQAKGAAHRRNRDRA
jgi:hypothetical protein